MSKEKELYENLSGLAELRSLASQGFGERLGEQRALICLPPPNATNNLHLGHALNAMLHDTAARAMAIFGPGSEFLGGTDHAGLATWRQYKLALGRDSFQASRDGCFEFAEKHRATITEQLETLGLSLELDKLRYTLDEGSQKATRALFGKLFRAGLIKRDKAKSWWCEDCQTNISDEEAGIKSPQDIDGTCERCLGKCTQKLLDGWFLDTQDMTRRYLKGMEKGEFNIQPERFSKILKNYLANPRAWALSRQIPWGHRPPMWQCNLGHWTMIQEADEGSIQKCGMCGGEAMQDTDALDTWFTSALWPFILRGWDGSSLEGQDSLEILYTAPEILTHWGARMQMINYWLFERPAFLNIRIHGTIRDIQGRKFSKSLGNGIDPRKALLRGTDALRYIWLRELGDGSLDLKLDQNRLIQLLSLWGRRERKIRSIQRWLKLEGIHLIELNEGLDKIKGEDRELDGAISQMKYIWRETMDGNDADRWRLDRPARAMEELIEGDWSRNGIPRWKEEFKGADRQDKKAWLGAKWLQTLALLWPLCPKLSEELLDDWTN